MKRIITIFSVMMICIAAASCHKKGYSTADETMPAKQYTAQQLADGKKIYDANCDKCHDFHEPAEFTAKKWGKILPKMCRKSELSKDKAELVSAWVVANAQK